MLRRWFQDRFEMPKAVGQKLRILFLFTLFSLFGSDTLLAEIKEGAHFEKGWSFSLYGGIYTSKPFPNALWPSTPEVEEEYFLGVAVAKKIAEWREFLSLEVEGIFAKHYGENMEGKQDYEEYVGALIIRYQAFPWEKYLKNTLAIGHGYSYATRLLGDENKNGLFFFMVEVTFALPFYQDLGLVCRIHHRSGGDGFIGRGDTNFYTLGLRYQF